ncbi:MAG TPA: porphobilinogen synthase, partial [Chlamydiales bacterium]|nr:porphobilinogen synthase [Chlamydiales bacterium]
MIDQEIKLTLPNRLRRNRKSESIRTLVRETDLKKSNLIQPFFLIDGYQKKEVIKEMPGIYRFSADLLLKKAEDLFEKGMKAIALFPVI